MTTTRTTIRLARPDELPALTTHPNDDERNDATSAYLTSLLDKGCTRPEWCLVAEDEGRLTGNVVLWTIPGRTVPMDIVLLEPRDLDTGVALLAEAAELARSLGAESQGHVLDSPARAPQYQLDPALREKVLTTAGFTLTRDGCRFEWAAGDPMPAPDERLRWRSMAELGTDPFIELLADTFTDTKDSILLAEIAEHGLRGAAEGRISEMKELQHEPGWFEIGYNTQDVPVAISMPALAPNSAVIGLVAVAPVGRGQGYATSVVARGTQLLTAAGVTELRGDCDTDNIAMVKAFERAGFTNFANRKMFDRPL